MEIRAPNAEAPKAMLAVGIAAGTAQTLDNLQAYAAVDPNIGQVEDQSPTVLQLD